MSVTNVRHKVILDGAEFSSPSSDISISSHRTRPLEVEVTRAPAAAFVACRRLRRRHVPRHRHTRAPLKIVNHNQRRRRIRMPRDSFRSPLMGAPCRASK